MVWGVPPGGVGVGVGTNGREVVGRGVLVREGLDPGEGGRRGVSASPALGLCLAPGPDRGLAGVGGCGWDAGRGRRCAARPVVRGSHWSCRQPGRVGGVASASRPRGWRCRWPSGSMIGSSEELGKRFPRSRGQRALAGTGCRRGDGSLPVALCRLVVRRDRPAAAGRAVVRRRPPWVGSRGFGQPVASPAAGLRSKETRMTTVMCWNMRAKARLVADAGRDGSGRRVRLSPGPRMSIRR